MAELQNQLRRVVGPPKLELPGLPAEGKINNDTLTKGDQGFGMLDGLRYASEDYKTLAVVTTEGLFKIWLREHRKWWRDNNVPQDPANALRHTSFYTQAMSTDAAVFKYVELPIRKPAAATLAFAMLGTSAQDVGPWEAEDVTVALLQGGKLYVVRVKTSAKIGPFPSCKAQWDQAIKKSRGNLKARGSGSCRVPPLLRRARAAREGLCRSGASGAGDRRQITGEVIRRSQRALFHTTFSSAVRVRPMSRSMRSSSLSRACMFLR